MKNIIVLLAILLIAISDVKAQTNLIIGTVYDAETNQSLRDVEVYWRNKKEDEVRSDKFGVFEIEKTLGDSILLFEFPGKQILSKNVMQEADYGELNVVLFNKGATSVTASRWEQSVNEIPASIVIITREEIEQQGYITLQEVLENVPGLFTMDHLSETDVTIGIRGFAGTFNRNVMIQVNGVSMLSERQNDFPLNKINVAVESIDKIEIVRGPMSVIYGAGAFFGVINIITNEASAGTNGLFATSYGTQNSFRNALRYTVNEKGLNLSLNAMHLQREGFQGNWSDMMIGSLNPEDSATVFYNYHNPDSGSYAGRSDNINPERYSTKHYGLNFSLDYEGFFARINYAKSNRGFSFIHPGSQVRNDYVSNTFNSQFGYRGSTKSGNFDYEIRSGYYHSLVDASYNYLDPTDYNPGEDRVSSIRSEVNTRTILFSKERGNRFDLDLILGASHNWNLENYSLYNAPEFGLIDWYTGLDPVSDLHTWAAYSQLDMKIEDMKFRNRNIGTLQMILGGRIEQQLAYKMLDVYNQNTSLPVMTSDTNDQNDSLNFIPRVALIYSLKQKNSNHFFRGMYGEAIKQSTVVNNSFDVMFFIPDSLADQRVYLKPETIKTLEFGYTYRNDSAKFEGNINYFNNNLKQLVVREATIVDGGYVAVSRNSGQLSTNGMEFIGSKWFDVKMANQKRLKIETSLNLSYQVTKGRDSLENKTVLVSFSPYLLGGVSIAARFGSFEGKKMYLGGVSLGISGNYVGEMNSELITDQSDTTLQVAPLIPVGEASEGYVRYSLNLRISDLRFNKKTASGGFFVNAKVANLMDNKYMYPTFNNASWASKGIIGRRRQMLVSIGYKF